MLYEVITSNIDVNVSVGTIFSIYRRLTPAGSPVTLADFLQPGHRQVVITSYSIHYTKLYEQPHHAGLRRPVRRDGDAAGLHLRPAADPTRAAGLPRHARGHGSALVGESYNFV